MTCVISRRRKAMKIAVQVKRSSIVGIVFLEEVEWEFLATF